MDFETCSKWVRLVMYSMEVAEIVRSCHRQPDRMGTKGEQGDRRLKRHLAA